MIQVSCQITSRHRRSDHLLTITSLSIIKFYYLSYKYVKTNISINNIHYSLFNCLKQKLLSFVQQKVLKLENKETTNGL